MEKDKKLLSLLAQKNNSEALINAGYSLSALRNAGYSASALRNAGYSASDLRNAGYSASDLRNAGYSASDLRNAGYSLSALINAGYSLSALINAGYSASALRINGFEFKEWDSIVPLEKPYTRIWNDIQNKKRKFDQSTFGPSEAPVAEDNICNTPMCTAGNLVNLAGAQGWELQQKYGFSIAASLIHQKSCPDLPEQNFNSIPDEWALAYLEEMAQRESLK